MKYPDPTKSLLVLIDMQEKLLRAMTDAGACSARCGLLLQAASAFGMPVIVTEQYPKGLGPTVPELAEKLPAGSPVIEKGAFSCFGEPLFVEAVEKAAPESLILCGIEAHVCAAQTALDAANRGMNVFAVRDAMTSRHVPDRESAFSLLQANGVQVLSAETLLFMLLRTSKHPAFKEISRLVK